MQGMLWKSILFEAHAPNGFIVLITHGYSNCQRVATNQHCRAAEVIFNVQNATRNCCAVENTSAIRRA